MGTTPSIPDNRTWHSGASANAPASVTGAGSSALTVNVAAGTAVGSFPLTITASSASPILSHPITPMLIVQVQQGTFPANLVFPPSPVEGTNLAAGGNGYQFNWDSGSGASGYFRQPKDGAEQRPGRFLAFRRRILASPILVVPLVTALVLFSMFLIYYLPATSRQTAFLNDRAFRTLGILSDQIQARQRLGPLR
jgi:hypothetical protein